MVELPAGADVDAFLRLALEAGAHVDAVSHRRESLEDYFIRQASLLPNGSGIGGLPGSIRVERTAVSLQCQP